MHNLEILIIPVISLMGLAFAFSSILRYSQNPTFTSVAFGLLFGASTIMAMSFPISFGEGFIFDLRSLLLGLCVVFAGWRAGLIALAMAFSFRVFLGGGGMMVGLFALVLTFGIAMLWRRFAVPRIKNGPLADFGFGIAVSGSLGAMVFLPREMALLVLTDLALIITLANIVGAVGLGFVFRREMQFFQDSEKLRMHAMLDPLTNLLNRRGAAERIKTIDHSKADGRALIYFDIDNFKSANDQHGHEAGDTVLATVASRIENVMRSENVFSRHGGDEFTIYFPTMKKAALESVAHRICATISSEPIIYRSVRLQITISAGGYWTSRPASFDEMLRHADEQLLLSKDNGRNQASTKLDQADDIEPIRSGTLAYAS